MSAHTPGPWSVTPSVPEEGFECFWLMAGDTPIGIANGPQDKTREANASLIAVAPELLEVAQLLAAFSFSSDVPLGDIQKKARAAIAKATEAT